MLWMADRPRNLRAGLGDHSLRRDAGVGPRILSAGQRFPITNQASSAGPLASRRPPRPFRFLHRASSGFHWGVIDWFHDGTMNLEPAPELMVAKPFERSAA